MYEDEYDNSSGKNFCDTCQKPFGGKKQLAAHFNSKIHLRKKSLEDLKEKSKFKSPTENPNTGNKIVNLEMQSSQVFEDTEEPRFKKRKINRNLNSNEELDSEMNRETKK